MITWPHSWSLDSPVARWDPSGDDFGRIRWDCWLHVGAPTFAPQITHPNNNKQYHICHMKTLAIRRDFDFSFFGFNLRFRVLGFGK